MTLRLALVGFGNVGRAFVRLLLDRRDVLRNEHHLDVRVTVIATRSHGWARDQHGLDLARLVDAPQLPERGALPSLGSLPADVLVEVSTLNPRDGQPALDQVRDALNAGMHVITANKGPIAHGYPELEEIARRNDRRLRFEATIADDLPVFNLARHALPTARILWLRGIVNSTTNYLLSQSAQGANLASALAEAQRLGIAERDPSLDLEGWDAAVKAVILANVLLGAHLRVTDVVREPIDESVAARARLAVGQGRRIRPVLTLDQRSAHWAPSELSPDDPLYSVDGLSMALQFETDVAGRLVVMLMNPQVEQVAFALLADLVSLTETGASPPTSAASRHARGRLLFRP